MTVQPRMCLLAALFALALTMLPQPGLAQNGEGTPAPAANATPANTTLPAEAMVRERFRTFSALGYGDRTVHAREALLQYVLPMPPGVTPTDYSGLGLTISHSPLLVPDLSTMTVSANGSALTSIALDASNQTAAQIEVQLPTAGFTGDRFVIDIAFSLRLATEDCTTATNQALWATVHASSTYYYTMTHTPGTADLATLDRQFTDLDSPVAIVLPPSPTAAELAAAGRVAFTIGRWNATAANPPAISVLIAGTAPITGPAVVIGSRVEAGAWPGLTWDGAAYATAPGPVAADSGVLALRQDPAPILLVSGATDAALAAAVAALESPDARTQLTGMVAVVTGSPPASAVAPAWSGETTDFAQLGVELQEHEVRGEGSQSLTLTVPRPAAWIAANGGTLTLRLRGSAALDPGQSWVAATLNGVPLGSALLTPEAGPTFILPAAAVNARTTLQLSLEFHLQLTASPCAPRDLAGAWVQLLPESSWTIPHDVYPALDLARLPAPFTNMPSLITLPDAPTVDDLAAGLQLAATFGKATGTGEAVSPRLVTANVVDDAQRAANALIVLGTGNANSLAAALASAAGGASPTAGSVMQFRMTLSPWSAQGTVLSIVPGAEGSANVASLFQDAAAVARLTGTSAAVDATLALETSSPAEPAVQPPDATPATGATSPDITPPPTLAVVSELPAAVPVQAEEVGDDDDDAADTSQIAGSVLLGVLLVGSVMWVWLRLRNAPTSPHRQGPAPGSGTGPVKRRTRKRD